MKYNEFKARKGISPQRKALYYGGMALMGLGLLMFFGVFISFAASFGDFGAMDQGPGSFVWAVAGMVLVIIGSLMRGVGARGLAGSGLMLDPEQAREDLSPYAHAVGGMVKDAAEGFREAGGQGPVQIKVRCGHCRALNNEDAKFCSQCGRAL